MTPKSVVYMVNARHPRAKVGTVGAALLAAAGAK